MAQIQDIVDLVLQALAANAKSIDDLTEALTVGEDDYIELNGGRKIAVSRLAELIGGSMAEVTHAELKALRDGGALVPGKQYRITDYTCTTVQEDTQSAGHQFDIIVTADDASTLNENARACLHDGDEYFAGCKLEAWKLKYTIDNDFERFEWAGSEYTYFLVDDNWKYIRRPDLDSEGLYAWVYLDEGVPDESDVMFTNTPTPSVGDFAYQEGDEYEIYFFVEEGDAPNAKGIIYYLKDEFNNECGYDFKNIMYLKNEYIFTFGGGIDASLNGDCHHNIILSNKALPQNTLGNSCFSIAFGNTCYNNSLGSECNMIVFGDQCSDNKIGDSCFNITFGSECRNNTFGTFCKYIAFDAHCVMNILGSECSEIKFGISCMNNTLGNNCNQISFSERCYYITFGIGETIRSNYTNITLGVGVQHCNLNCSAPSSGYVSNVHVNTGVRGNASTDRKTLTVPTADNEFLTTFCTANDTKIDV